MKQTLYRALRTFCQAAGGYLIANVAAALAGQGSDWKLWRTALMGLLVSAAAAGLAAVMNLPGQGGEEEDHG